MKKVYTTAMGKKIDFESLKAVNEETIAVGNMKVNARGDELGPGGAVQRPRNAAIADHYHIANSETREDKIRRQRMAGASTTNSRGKRTNNIKSQESEITMSEDQNTPNDQESAESSQPEATAAESTSSESGRRLRGSLADSMAKETTVTQEKMPDPRRPKGPTRI